MPSFGELGVPSVLVRSLAESGITEPFPIQSATLRDTLAGRDVLGRGRTGSGKTLAFAIPLVARIRDGAPARSGAPRALVLAPTRELANQLVQTVAPLARAAGLQHTVIYGGVSQGRQVAALRRGVDIAIATPGRLEDLKGQGHLRLDATQITVLDEADHMADLGFLPAVRRILDATPRSAQRMLFSATLDNGVDVLVKRYLTDPLTHSVDPPSSAVTTMDHHVLEVPDADAKRALVTELASGSAKRLFFTRTKHQARKLARQLTTSGIPAVDLHGNLSQSARERNLAAFSTGAVRVLVATDIAARGIHVDDVDLVTHVDPPAEHKAYLHRSGRTARAGSGGSVVTIVLPEQRTDVRRLMRAAKVSVKPVPAQPTLVTELVGEAAPRLSTEQAQRVVPGPPATPSSKGSNGRGGGSGRSRPRGRAGGQPRRDGSRSRGQEGNHSRGENGSRSRGRGGSRSRGNRPRQTAAARRR